MTPDQYVQSILQKYDVSRGGTFVPLLQVAWPLSADLGAEFGGSLQGTELSGSNAKGTAVLGGTDVDLFLSFAPDEGYYLRDIYLDVYDLAQKKGWRPRKQNVSIGVTYNGWSVDLVPGRRQPNSWQGDHWLYRRRVGSWQQTNVRVHINTIKASLRTNEIRAIKIWRNLHGLDFPSFYLELTVIHSLAGVAPYYVSLGANIGTAFRYLASSFEGTRVIDPANSNNVISDDLNAQEKTRIARAAETALTTDWTAVIW